MMKVVFFGTPEFAADVLTYLLQHHVDIVAIVTRPDRPKGRSGEPAPSAVKLAALANTPPIPLHQPSRSSTPEFVELLKTYNADLFIVVAYGEIVKDSVLAIPRCGCINVHPSILPKFRGAAPIHRAIINGDAETAVSIMYMAREMDAGDVIAMTKVPIGPETTCGELESQLSQLGARMLLQVIHDLERGIVNRTPQDHSQVTFAKKIELEDCQIDWSRAAQELHNLVRGTNPHPGAWCNVVINGAEKRLKVVRSRVEKDLSGNPGDLLNYGKDGLIVACGQQALRLLEVKPEGKRAMPAEDMMRGISREHFQFKCSPS